MTQEFWGLIDLGDVRQASQS